MPKTFHIPQVAFFTPLCFAGLALPKCGLEFQTIDTFDELGCIFGDVKDEIHKQPVIDAVIINKISQHPDQLLHLIFR
jgi:hypothetical protein